MQTSWTEWRRLCPIKYKRRTKVDFLNAITLTKPTGLWQTVLFWFEGLVNNYAVAIILLTVLVRLCFVPIDFMNKYSSKKSARLQNAMKPELDKINQKYAGQKDLLNQKTMEVYKRYKFNVTGMCFTMLIPMILQLVIFTSIFSALGTVSKYESANQYLEVREAYFSVYEIDVNEELGENETLLGKLEAYTATLTEEQKQAKLEEANEKALDKYRETQDSFLWIENIWLPDTAWTNPVISYKTFLSDGNIDEELVSEDEFKLVMASPNENTRNCNGFFVLVILSVVASYLSTAINGWITKARAKKKGLNMNQVGVGGSGKLMMWILPIIIGLIILFYNAAFAIYSTMGSLVLLVTNPLMTVFIDMLEFEAIEKEQKRTIASYSRKRK